MSVIILLTTYTKNYQNIWQMFRIVRKQWHFISSICIWKRQRKTKFRALLDASNYNMTHFIWHVPRLEWFNANGNFLMKWVIWQEFVWYIGLVLVNTTSKNIITRGNLFNMNDLLHTELSLWHEVAWLFSTSQKMDDASFSWRRVLNTLNVFHISIWLIS